MVRGRPRLGPVAVRGRGEAGAGGGLVVAAARARLALVVAHERRDVRAGTSVRSARALAGALVHLVPLRLGIEVKIRLVDLEWQLEELGPATCAGLMTVVALLDALMGSPWATQAIIAREATRCIVPCMKQAPKTSFLGETTSKHEMRFHMTVLCAFYIVSRAL